MLIRIKLAAFCLVALLFAVPLAAHAGKPMGKPITLQEKTLISDILANPKEFVGKRVLVSGMIVGVCSKRGCWMELASDKPFGAIQIKVNDGEIVFPMESMGSQALVEGTVEELPLSLEQTISYKKHLAEEQGQQFDPESVAAPETVYRIRGFGAIIGD